MQKSLIWFNLKAPQARGEVNVLQIPDSFLEELRARADIEQLISPYVQLRRSGRALMGLCPFHNERTASFAVYPDTNSFFCFGCGAGGDAISFLMRMERLDYIEAVKTLSQRLGMQLPEDQYDDSLAKRRQRILAANREAARFYHAQLSQPQGRAGLEYWQGRGLSPKTIQRFGLGYAPNGFGCLLDHMRGKGYDVDELLAANLVRKGEKNGRAFLADNFWNRVMVPILDLRGNVVAFGGRVLDDSKPKYINTSDTLAYKKGHDIFALNLAKNTTHEQLILAEGYMDVIALHQAGFVNAVACLGTALTREQAQLLARYAKEVVLAYDADEAGQAATRKALGILGQTTLRLRVLRLSGGKDPDEIIRSYGAEKFRSLLEGSANSLEYRLLTARGALDLESPDGKAAYLKEAVKLLAAYAGAMEQDIYASRLGEELSVDKNAILLQVKQAAKRDERKETLQKFSHMMRLQPEAVVKLDPQRGLHPAAAAAEERLLGLLQLHPDFYARLRETLQAEDFVTPFNRRMAEILFGRLEEGRGIEPELLSGCMNQAELSEAMRMRQHQAALENPLQECLDSAQRLLAEKADAGKPGNPAAVDNDTYLALFEGLRTGQ
ncbi:MAG: DNA primase [Oscillospiraceae bacterium]|nr:DNA primase [Oscillospiraceae bacterium]